MRGKFEEKYAVELPADVLRFPPVSLHEKEIWINTEYAQVKIENPLTISAWRCLLRLLRYGRAEKMSLSTSRVSSNSSISSPHSPSSVSSKMEGDSQFPLTTEGTFQASFSYPFPYFV
jgi:hypothetical protein